MYVVALTNPNLCAKLTARGKFSNLTEGCNMGNELGNLQKELNELETRESNLWSELALAEDGDFYRTREEVQNDLDEIEDRISLVKTKICDIKDLIALEKRGG